MLRMIGADVMIGANCTILPGIKIDDGAMVGAGSLVNSDIPPGVLAAGVPARVIRGGLNRRTEEIHEHPK